MQEDLARAEMLAFPLLFLLSLVVFRSVVAALLPVIVGATTILTTFVWMRMVNTVEPMSVFAINLITGAGLGLAIDYSLFVVSRFREELATGAERGEALRATMRTAGRTVLFSAVTVAAAMASLIVFDLRFLYSMGVGGVLVALTAALVSLTVLPALLAALGPRVNALSLKRWQVAMHRDAAHVRGGPVVPVLAGRDAAARADRGRHRGAADRARAAVPADRVHRRRRERAAARTARRAWSQDALDTEFPPGRTSPIYVVARSGDAAAVRALRDRARRLPGVEAVPRARAGRRASGGSTS